MKKQVVLLCRQSSKEQMSLDEQERLGRAYAARIDAHVVRCWRVVGGTSDEQITRFFDDMRANGVTAYDDLEKLWEEKRFDTLWALDATRIGRSKWLYNYICERTILSGADIYLEQGGVINRQNFDAMVAVTSINSKADIEKLHGSRAHATYRAKAEQGIPPRKVNWMFDKVRDDKGKVIGMTPSDEARHYIPLITDMLLTGLSYRGIVDRLSDKFKTHTTLRESLYYPPGHGHLFVGAYTVRHQGFWCLEDGHPVPDGVTVYYDVIEPVWDRHAQVIAELKSRLTTNRRLKPNRAVNPLNGIVVCARCGSNLQYDATMENGTLYPYLRCGSRCGAPLARLDDLVGFVDRILRDALKTGFLTATATNNGMDRWRAELADITDQIQETEGVLSRLVMDMARQPDLRDIYQAQIDSQSNRLAQLKQRLNTTKSRKPFDPTQQRQTLEEIHTLSVDALWSLPVAQANAILRRVFGPHRLAVEKKRVEII